MPSFPPLEHLGYGLDLTTVNPIGVEGVVNAIKKFYPIVDVDSLVGGVSEYTVGDDIYKVPKLVSVSGDIKNAAGSLVTYDSGSKASAAFNGDAKLSLTYGAVSGSASATYGYNKTFKEDTMLAFYSASYNVYHASLKNYGSCLNEINLIGSLKKLPLPFDGSMDDLVDSYRAFFNAWGSHLIVGCSYGSRYQLTVRQTKTASTDTTNWSANVKASYTGVVSGKGDVKVKDQSSFDTFNNEKLVEVSVRGGDISLAQALSSAKDSSAADFEKWQQTANTNPDVTNFTTTDLWSILKFAQSDEVSKYALHLEKAFNWVLSHPKEYKTDLSFNIESDWAEFGLLTPGARISGLEALNNADKLVLATPLKLRWGHEWSLNYKKRTIQFSIMNDGSPIDFYICHGYNGAGVGNGQASILLNGKFYENAQVMQNQAWNTVRFFQKPVNGTPALVKPKD